MTNLTYGPRDDAAILWDQEMSAALADMARQKGEAARAWRRSRHLTQAELALESGYSVTAIRDFENGARRGKVGKYAEIDEAAWLRYRLACSAIGAGVAMAF